MATKIMKDTTKRRRFQAPITSFFSASTATPTPTDNNDDLTNNPPLSHYHYSAATYSPTPVVPAKVQSSLLSVGMRVRKSVAEGYKTKKNLENEKNAVLLSCGGSAGAGAGPTSELAPFCGASKAGDAGVESLSRPMPMHSHSDLVTDEGDAFSLPSSSQSSDSSSFPPLNGGTKRSFDYSDDDYDEGDMDGFECAGRGPEPGGGLLHTHRTILAPSLGQQRRRFKNFNAPARKQQQQHAMDVDGDFEEASFLCRREDVEMDGI